jgi:hypothetical protein
MVEKEQPDIQINYLLADFNTRLRDIEEKNKVSKDRLLLLGQNLISSREELTKELDLLKKEQNSVRKELDKLKGLIENILSETDNFVRKDEILMIERMLKDFQPLEFARVKDVEEMFNSKFGVKQEKQNIKTVKTSKYNENEVNQ